MVTGKLGRAWAGAWLVHGMVHGGGDVGMMCGGGGLLHCNGTQIRPNYKAYLDVLQSILQTPKTNPQMYLITKPR